MPTSNPELEHATVPDQPVATPPVKKGFPLAMVLVAIIVVIALANVGSLIGGKGKKTTNSNLSRQPATISSQQVKNYEALQANEARHDAEDRQQRAQLQATMQAAQVGAYPPAQVPGPEVDTAAPMTPQQRQAIYGDSPNAPKHTSGASQAHAEAKQRELVREKQHQDALASDTVAIDFARTAGNGVTQPTAVLAETQQDVAQANGEELRPAAAAGQGTAQQRAGSLQTVAGADQKKNDPMAAYQFDDYQGRLFRVFEGTVLEGVVTNHIDGAFAGPFLVLLTTDYYSHDHQQLLMPQGTRLIGTVQSAGSQGQRKLMVTFHRAVCPDGFSLDFDKYVGLDPIGTTGLASHVDSHILSSFAAAAAIGGLGGLAQIGNAASVLTPSAEVRDGISSQTSQEAEQILNHFLNRLPTITLKEGSRARVYIGRDILIPSYAEHRVDPTL